MDSRSRHEQLQTSKKSRLPFGGGPWNDSPDRQVCESAVNVASRVKSRLGDADVHTISDDEYVEASRSHRASSMPKYGTTQRPDIHPTHAGVRSSGSEVLSAHHLTAQNLQDFKPKCNRMYGMLAWQNLLWQDEKKRFLVFVTASDRMPVRGTSYRHLQPSTI